MRGLSQADRDALARITRKLADATATDHWMPPRTVR
jgi:hypothetical protein